MTNLDYKIASRTFPNGAKLFVMPLWDSPTVAMQLAVATGSVHEQEFMGCGLSHFLEHMLFQGTKNYPGHDASDLINQLGGDNNAFTSYYQTVYHITLPAKHCSQGLNVLADMAINPLFPAEKFASEKEVICHERLMRQDSAGSVLVEGLFELVFQRHPARYPIIGYLDKIKSVEREMMCEYYNRRYRPHLTSFVITGPIDIDTAYAMLEPKISEWERGSLEPLILPQEPEQLHFRDSSGYFEDQFSRVAVGVKIPPASHPDTPVLEILSGIIGENSSSRLVNELHQKSELATNVGSSIYPMAGEGIMLFSGASSSQKYEQMCGRMLEVLEDVRINGVTEQEVAREKNQQIAITLREMRSAEDLASQITQGLVNYSQPISPINLLDSYRHITVDDVNRVAKKYLLNSKMNQVNLLNTKCKISIVTKSNSVGNEDIIEKNIGGTLESVTMLRPKLPLTEIAIITPGGVTFENSENCGISRLLSSMVFAGTKRYKEEELLEFLDDYAIETSATSGLSSNMYTFNVPSEHQDKLYEAILEIFGQPKWSKRTLNREKSNLLEALKSRMLNPLQRAIESARNTLYNGHVGGLSRMDNLDVLENLSNDEVLNYFKASLNSSQTVIGVGGDFSPELAEEFLTSFAKITAKNSTPLPVPAEPEFITQSSHTNITIPREQCAVVYMLAGCNNMSRDRLAFDLLQHSENGLASQLFTKVREDNSLAYSTGMASSRSFYSGSQAFYAMTTTQNREQTLELLKSECERLATTGLTEEEFKAALAAVSLECAEQYSGVDNLLRATLLQKFYNLPVQTLEERLAEYNALTLAEVNEVLKRYFTNPATVSVYAGADV